MLKMKSTHSFNYSQAAKKHRKLNKVATVKQMLEFTSHFGIEDIYGVVMRQIRSYGTSGNEGRQRNTT